MSYTSPEAVRDVLSRDESQTAGTGASLDTETILEQIQQADQEIDGRLSGVYKTPFAPVPPLISQISTAIAAYLSDLIFREVRDYQTELNPVVLRYKRAQELLKALAKGEMDLPGSTPADSQTGGGVIVATHGTEASFCDSDFAIHCYQSPNTSRAFPSSDCWGQW